MILSEEQLDAFQQKGMVILDGYLREDFIQAMRDHLVQLESSYSMRRAGIGKGSETQVIDEQRGDYIHWIDFTDIHTVMLPYRDKMEELRLELNRNFYLGLVELEAHLAVYPSGAYYKKHRDRHQKGSRRAVSAALYLNTTWEKDWGGQLCVDLEDGSQCEVEPKGGRLVFFLSELLHEVRPTRHPRMSLTGWFLQP